MKSVIKQGMVSELKRELDAHPYTFISNLESLSVEALSTFRRDLEKVSGRTMMVKHTIARRVFEDSDYAKAGEFFKHAVVLTFADKEPQDVSRVLIKIAKQNNKIVPAGVIFENKIYDHGFIQNLSILPSRKELLTQVVVRVKSPISGLVLGLGGIIRGLVQTLSEIKKQREAAPQAAA
ncbi:MAG: 50S ribosomal protein L10 [Candidatus Omnitrophota bacterium]|nr:50S ribosomal protein L10 [Candidatus Omnitrophota bacterium]